MKKIDKNLVKEISKLMDELKLLELIVRKENFVTELTAALVILTIFFSKYYLKLD